MTKKTTTDNKTTSTQLRKLDLQSSIQEILIDDRSRTHEMTAHILAQFPNTPTRIISDTNQLIKDEHAHPDGISRGKQRILLTINKGRFMKKCPGTKNYLCCGYQILHPGSQCPLDCSYCILQSYFNNPFFTFFTNTQEMLQDLKDTVREDPSRLWRIGTGEFTDSLANDTLTGLSKKLIPFFMKTPNAILELKTKTVEIDHLLSFNPQKKVIAAWSLNAESIIKTEERFAASLEERFIAASLCAERGYLIAFHFDPLFYFPGWEKEYTKTVDRIFAAVKPSQIAWISMGCFRYMPTLKKVIEDRFPTSAIAAQEFHLGEDGKLRYPRPVRVAMYKALYNRIKQHAPDACVYLCMESDIIWRKAFGLSPKDQGGIAKMLDRAVFSG